VLRPSVFWFACFSLLTSKGCHLLGFLLNAKKGKGVRPLLFLKHFRSAWLLFFMFYFDFLLFCSRTERGCSSFQEDRYCVAFFEGTAFLLIECMHTQPPTYCSMSFERVGARILTA